MRFHHMCIVTTDIDKAISLWRDVLGFKVEVDTELPDAPSEGIDSYGNAKLLEDGFGVKGAAARMAFVSSEGGALIELLQPRVPHVQLTNPRELLYENTGFHELGLLVDDIDAVFETVKKAGLKVQTEYVWSCADMGRSFIFYDHEGNMIQMWEQPKTAAAA